MSSPTLYPGTAAFKYDGNGVYSPITTVKTGVGYTNMLNGNERWGDYTGCQTRFNMPGWVWVNGSYSQINHTTRTYIGELTVTSGVSVNEIEQQEADINVFPNPAEETVTIEFDKTTDGWILIRVTDIQGREIQKLYSGSIGKGKNSFSFNAASLSSGNYQVTISDGGGTVIASKKFVKQ